MIIVAFVLLFVVITAGYVQNFPGGFKGFSACMKFSLKKGLGLMTKSLRKGGFIRWRDTRSPCGSCHPQ